MAWLYEPELYQQLPPAFRLLAWFFRAQRPLGGSLAGVRAALRLAAAAVPDGSVRLSLGNGAIAYLDAADPRCLAVPLELRSLLEPDSILRRLLAAGDTFVDVGANHGSFSIAASTIVGASGQVVSVEPQPRLRERLERALGEMGAAPATVFPVACGDRAGEATLYSPAASSGSAGLFPGFSAAGRHRSFEVRLARLDDLMSEVSIRGRVLVKLDIEGGERSALEGARTFMREHRPRLLLEIHPAAMRAAGTTSQALMRELARCGFRSYQTLEAGGAPRPLAQLRVRRHRDVLLLPQLADSR